MKIIELLETGNSPENALLERAMLVDDSAIDNFINLRILKDAEFATTIYHTKYSEAAFKHLEENAQNINQLPNLIFLDLNMPKLNGEQFVAKFNQLPKTVSQNCKIIILTGSLSFSEMAVKAWSPHIIGVLRKPLIRKNLREIKSLILNRHKELVSQKLVATS